MAVGSEVTVSGQALKPAFGKGGEAWLLGRWVAGLGADKGGRGPAAVKRWRGDVETLADQASYCCVV